MVQETLVEYVRRLLQQGYDAGTIRTTLTNAGYSPSDVNYALQLAGAPVEKRISTQTLVIAFLIILILAGGILLALKLLQPAPAILSFSASLFSTKISPGQDLAVNFDIQNPSGTKTEGLIDYYVTGPSGKIASKTESFTVTTRTSIPSTVSLPGATPGAYTVQATLNYGGKSITKSADFEITEAMKKTAPGEALKEKTTEQAKAAQATCPSGCDDLNFCTTDACQNGICIHTPITPCCGNNQCEAGETQTTCVLDCAERPIGPDEINAKAKELAVTDLPKALESCESMAQRVLIDGCLSTISEASGSKEPCTRVADSDVRDACYIPFAYKNDFSVCSQITNPYMKNSCTSLAEISNIKATLPQQ
ncbi:Uncharacterised protein [uncultured archaeon]|nr:Uncharacterised protein [uncultured archaeon]